MQEINEFLDSELIRRAKRWKGLEKYLAQALPPELLERISYASVDDGILTMFCDSPEWTSRIRFHAAELIETFAQEGQVITEVSTRTVPKTQIRPPAET